VLGGVVVSGSLADKATIDVFLPGDAPARSGASKPWQPPVVVHPEGGVAIDGRRYYDDFDVMPENPWRCHNCKSEWMLYPLNRLKRYRFLHEDESCPCYGGPCMCRSTPTLFEVA
jgi:hypothetical protein